MSFLVHLLFKLGYYGITVAYPGYKAHESIKSSKIEKLWLVYFLIMGLLAMLQWTLLYPIVLIFDYLCSWIFPCIKILFAGWLYHNEYRGALLLEQVGREYLSLSYHTLQPFVGKVLAMVGVPSREESNKQN